MFESGIERQLYREHKGSDGAEATGPRPPATPKNILAEQAAEQQEKQNIDDLETAQHLEARQQEGVVGAGIADRKQNGQCTDIQRNSGNQAIVGTHAEVTAGEIEKGGHQRREQAENFKPFPLVEEEVIAADGGDAIGRRGTQQSSSMGCDEAEQHDSGGGER